MSQLPLFVLRGSHPEWQGKLTADPASPCGTEAAAARPFSQNRMQGHNCQAPSFTVGHTNESKHSRAQYLVFGHGAEVIVPKEDAQFPFLYRGGKLAQAMVRQLCGGVVEELLGHRT